MVEKKTLLVTAVFFIREEKRCKLHKSLPVLGTNILLKHTTLLEGEKFLKNKHKIEFFLNKIAFFFKCSFFGRKENIISDSRFFY